MNLRNRHFLILDLIVLLFTPFMAVVLRIGSAAQQWHDYQTDLVFFTLVSLVIKPIIFYFAGIYRRYWRYASVGELHLLLFAVGTTTVILTVMAWAVHGMDSVPMSWLPRSVPFIDGLLTLLAVGGIRFAARAGSTSYAARRRAGEMVKKRVLVVGAGDAGAMIVREMRSSGRTELEPVGFVDDADDKQSIYVHGVLVLGCRSDIPRLVDQYRIDEVIIAMPTASGKTIRETVAMCETAGVPSLTLPSINEILAGRVRVNQLRNVEIEDLLRREPITTGSPEITTMLKGATILVTGAGGSIGSELCRQILRADPARLILLGHGENSLFLLNQDLRRLFPDAQLHNVVADVRDEARMHQVFARFRPQIVFHAAAHKHVPMMEDNIEDAVSNNVLGTRILTEMAEKYGAERLVAISSDKAVNPSSVMGATKRICELIVHDAGVCAGRPFVSVRFGNVLGSRGSVVPYFRQQIEKGGPVTITDPNVTRYFMTIPEAVQLVLQAGAMGQAGDLFVLDMGSPIRIVDLARDLIRLSGLEEGRDIDISFTGLRPGEKLHEELFSAAERFTRTEHDKIFLIRNGVNPTTAEQAAFATNVSDLIAAAQTGGNGVRALMKRIVPEWETLEISAEALPRTVDAIPIIVAADTNRALPATG